MPAQAYRFEVNPAAAAERREIGRERRSILIIEHFLLYPDDLIAYAANDGAFKPAPAAENFYPGLRAPAPKDYALNLTGAIRPYISDVFGFDADIMESARCALSIVTNPPEALIIAQRIPHFDTVHERQLATVHYFCAAEFGGTGFFRHRETGFESVTRERMEKYRRMVQLEIERDGPPLARYVAGSTDLYEETARVEAKFNRLLVYPSNMLHSGLINVEAGLNADPARGRLTTNLFARFR